MIGALLDLVQDAVSGVRTRPARTVLSGLGIALAIATVVAVVGVPAGARAALDRELTALGSDVLVAQSASADQPVALPPDAAAMVRRIGPVRTAAAVAPLGAAVARTRFADPNTTVGISALVAEGDLLDAVHGRVASGAWLNGATARLSGVVLGSTAAQWLGIPAALPGGRVEVSVGGRSFTVVGVLAALPLAPDLDQAVFVGAASARARLAWSGAPATVYLRADESQLGAVRAVLPATLDPGLPGLIAVSRPSDVLAAKRLSGSAFASLALALAGVALVVGGLGVSNTMIVAVLERRREIGVRRALGSSRRAVGLLFLTEAVLLTVLGAVAGLLLGGLVVVGWSLLQGWPVVLDPVVAVLGVVGAGLVGGIAGIHPALRAARLSPTEALAAP